MVGADSSVHDAGKRPNNTISATNNPAAKISEGFRSAMYRIIGFYWFIAVACNYTVKPLIGKL